jgi:hypothetical protein
MTIMATKESSDSRGNQIGSALAFRDESLQTRPEWGTITFKKAADNFNRIFEILVHLSRLPLGYLTDSAVSQMQSCVTPTAEVLGRIDQFHIEQQTPAHVRDNLVGELHGQADQFYQHASC